MIKNIPSLLLTIVSALLLTSCLSSNDEEVVYYEDTAVTAFSLGTLKITYHTTASDGVTDSTYTSTLDCSSYKFYIDQLSQTIYNPDSLPVGIDPSAALATVTTKNSGTAVLNLYSKSGADSLAYYSSNDSIDFTNPVRLRVYNMMGTAYREYTVHVNVHKESGDEFSWKATDAGLSTLASRRFVNAGSTFYLFGQSGDNTVGYCRKDGAAWSALTMATTLDADAYKNVIAQGTTLYTLSDNHILTSADGQTWTNVAEVPAIKQLLGATDQRLYALTDNGIMQSIDQGATWTSDSLDDEATNLPTGDINFIAQPSRINSDTYNLTLIGNRNGKTVVWSKVEEDAKLSQTQPWAFYSSDEYNRKTLPALSNLQVVAYDNQLFATGGDFSHIYTSPDQGLTWSTDDTYTLPDDFGLSATSFAFGVDSSNILYISKAGSSTIWSGRLARLAWANNQKVFTK